MKYLQNHPLADFSGRSRSHSIQRYLVSRPSCRCHGVCCRPPPTQVGIIQSNCCCFLAHFAVSLQRVLFCSVSSHPFSISVCYFLSQCSRPHHRPHARLPPGAGGCHFAGRPGCTGRARCATFCVVFMLRFLALFWVFLQRASLAVSLTLLSICCPLAVVSVLPAEEQAPHQAAPLEPLSVPRELLVWRQAHPAPHQAAEAAPEAAPQHEQVGTLCDFVFSPFSH